MVYLAYSKPNKCARSEMSAEGVRLLRALLEQAGENTDVELAREPSGRPYIIGRNTSSRWYLNPQDFHLPDIIRAALIACDGCYHARTVTGWCTAMVTGLIAVLINTCSTVLSLAPSGSWRTYCSALTVTGYSAFTIQLSRFCFFVPLRGDFANERCLNFVLKCFLVF